MARFRVLLVGLLLSSRVSVLADASISATNRFAYGANVGWINFHPDATHGAAVGEFCCLGYVYSANCGWMSLGRGAPTNGVRYGNAATNDWGVNMDAAGNLRGFAYGANVGWVAFESNGAPRVDFATGDLSGYAYGANVGWISLSNNAAHVQTESLAPAPDTDWDGLPDAWEREAAGGLGLLARDGDADRDGAGDEAEYVAGTDPCDAEDSFRAALKPVYGGTYVLVSWPSAENRVYALEAAVEPGAAWSTDAGATRPAAGDRTARLRATRGATSQVFRVRAELPLRGE